MEFLNCITIGNRFSRILNQNGNIRFYPFFFKQEDEFEEGDDDEDEVSDGTTLSSILEDYGGDGLNGKCITCI